MKGDIATREDGKYRGIGRPKGSSALHTKASAKKLKELGFDPIEKLVQTYHEVQDRIDREEKKVRPASVAIAQLVSIRAKIANDLLRYGYGRIPEIEGEDPDSKEPIKIILTKENSKNGSTEH